MYQINGYREAKAILDDLTDDKQIRRILTNTMAKSVRPMLQSAKDNAPVKSGALRKSIKYVNNKDNNLSKGSISKAIKVNLWYGRFFHEGTKERKPRKTNIIRYRSKKGKEVVVKSKLLRFKDKSGKWISVHSVAPIKPNPFLRKAYDDNVNRLVSDFGDNLGKAIIDDINKNKKTLGR